MFIIFMAQMLDFEFVEKEKFPGKDDFPIGTIFFNHRIPTPVKLSKRKFE